MPEGLIEEQAEFDDLCVQIREAGIVAFDTEFVTEDTYRPELCLLQLATDQISVAVDPYRVERLDAWWELMADDQTTVVVHGGQAEIKFCLQLGGSRPRKLVDVQLAEGLQSTSYPLGYEALVQRVLGKHVSGKETRSDWRRRPLSARQIIYAREDVDFVLPVWDRQRQSLQQLKRLEWFDAESELFIDDVEKEYYRKGAERLSGLHKLRPRELAVASALAAWRDAEADRLNKPLRRMLRDDLIIELARRQPKTVGQLMETRDMNRSNYRKSAEALVACIQQAVAIPDDQLPRREKGDVSRKRDEEQALGQLLNMALSNRCAQANVSRQLIGTSADLRQLVRSHVFGETNGPLPRLASGWRAEVCGNLLTDLLDGKVSLRVSDPKSDHPLVFEWFKPESD